MRLVIAEKVEAARAIATILGEPEECELEGIAYFTFDDSVVVAARGHLLNSTIKGLRCAKIGELPKAEVKWTVYKANKKVLAVIRKLSQGAGEVVVATDYDREGEVIGWNICQKLGIKYFKRAYFSALTEREVKRAFENAGPVDEALLAQGLARNYADLIVGMNLTKALTLLYKQENPGLTQAISGGRVQSPLLRVLVANTGAEIRGEPELVEEKKVWVWNYLVVNGKHYGIISSRESIGSKVKVLETWDEIVEEDQASQLFNTDDIIAEVEIAPDLLMKILESLYLKGWATYPRTETHYIDPEILEELEDKIGEFMELSEGWGYENCPLGEPTRKQAIVLTEKGIEAYFNEKLRGQERFVAAVVLDRMLKAFACPLRKRKTYLKLRYVDGEEEDVEWSDEVENIEQSINSKVKSELKPEIKPRIYRTLTVREPVDQVTVSRPLYDISQNVYTDTDLVAWMSKVGLGTEATQVIFPLKLRERKYTVESNLPTLLGEEVAKIVASLGLGVKLTREMEERIGKIQKIDELNSLNAWIVGMVADFIKNLKGSFKMGLRCPRGHKVKLVNTRSGKLLMLCRKCSSKGKFYPI